MSCVGRDIAKAIVDDCNATTWSQDCKFSSVYVPREDLESLRGLAVTVVYMGQRAVPDSRAAWRHEYDIDIGVQKKLTTDTDDEADYYSDLLDAIADYWKTHTPGTTAARLVKSEWINPYVPDHMTTNRVFTGVIRLTFRLVRSN